MKKPQDNQLHNKQVGKQEKTIYEIIPNGLKILPREQKPLNVPLNITNDYILPLEDVKLFSEWPADEEVKVNFN